MKQVASLHTTLHIQRESPGGERRVESFDVPFEDGGSLLDGLRWIRATHDPTLAIRFSCINANACKECMMELDGAVVYACTARLKPGEMHVAPLRKKALIQDLVTEIAPGDERLLR
jgi:succinate dehydrogenase/fumarate reductase-like Fe-S protein